MKLKNLFFLTVICWSLGIMACEPDTPAEPESHQHPFTLKNAAPAPDVERAIDDFETYLARTNAKFGDLEPMRVADVVWSVEAALNRKYTNLAHNFGRLHTRKDTIPINRSGDIMVARRIHDFYNKALKMFSDHFYSLPNDNRLPVMVDVAENPDNPNTLILTTQVGTRVLGDFILGFHNDWWWGFGNGSCNGQNQMSDAAEELQEQLNRRAVAINDLDVIPCSSTDPPVCTSTYYPTSVESVVDGVFPGYLNPDDVTPNDNHRDFLLYENNPQFDDWDNKKCIVIDDMDFYFDGAVQLIDIHRPTGKDFISVDMLGTTQTYPPAYKTRHVMETLSFGEMVVGYNPIELLPSF